VTGRADRWIRRTTIGCVTILALIAGTVSYLHMHAWDRVSGKRKNYSPEFKYEAARMVVDSSQPIAHVAREIGVHEVTLGTWVKVYRDEHAGEDPPQLPVAADHDGDSDGSAEYPPARRRGVSLRSRQQLYLR
jgi:transposase-like protein